MKAGDIVKFREPFPDEDPNTQFVLLDEPEAAERQAEKLRKAGYPKFKAYVKIQVLGSKLPFPPINTVHLEDICAC